MLKGKELKPFEHLLCVGHYKLYVSTASFGPHEKIYRNI